MKLHHETARAYIALSRIEGSDKAKHALKIAQETGHILLQLEALGAMYQNKASDNLLKEKQEILFN